MVLNEQREMGRLLRLELEDSKRTSEKLAEAKKEIEVRNRKISELTETTRLQQQVFGFRNICSYELRLFRKKLQRMKNDWSR